MSNIAAACDYGSAGSFTFFLYEKRMNDVIFSINTHLMTHRFGGKRKLKLK